MSEGDVTIDTVWHFLGKAPDLADKLGITKRSQLSFLGAGGNAEVVYLGDHRVLKVTRSSAQGAMSRLAMEEQPESVVRVFDVVEVQDKPRGLPELPRKGEAPVYESRAWGVVEELTVPLDALGMMLEDEIAGVRGEALLERYKEISGGATTRRRYTDPDLRWWRESYEAAVEWVYEACDRLGTQADLDIGYQNWGVRPANGELVLIDLGQCYSIP